MRRPVAGFEKRDSEGHQSHAGQRSSSEQCVFSSLPIAELPLLEAVNALVDALVNPTSLSPSQLQRIEERVAALEAAVSLLSPPHADHHPVDRPAVSHQSRYLPLPPALLAEPLVLRVSDEPLLRHLPDDPAVAGLSSLPLPRRRCTTTRRFSISSRPTRRT